MTITIVEKCEVGNDDGTRSTCFRTIVLPLDAIEYDVKNIIKANDDFEGECLNSETILVEMN